MTAMTADHEAQIYVAPPEEVDSLHERLQKLQEPKGYYFNSDDQMTRDLLGQLLVTKSIYGYMSCPCRLTNGKLELDKDIICPCVYREADVKEYGACFCGLYVSRARHDGQAPAVYVPERRPPEKIVF
jgi:ferredoxin-thioredoxin reductase catalytic subunit